VPDLKLESTRSDEQGSLGGTSRQDWDPIQIHTKRPWEGISYTGRPERSCIFCRF